jgi:hypothetical protein
LAICIQSRCRDANAHFSLGEYIFATIHIDVLGLVLFRELTVTIGVSHLDLPTLGFGFIEALLKLIANLIHHMLMQVENIDACLKV